jgi:ferredoxin
MQDKRQLSGLARNTLAADHEIDAAVDRFLCVGSGPCFVIAPGAFGLDDSMKAVVLEPRCEPEEALLSAARQCPTQAIYLSRQGKAIYP